jgi:hypothetical protein
MHLRNKLSLAATMVSLGGLTGVAIHAGTGKKRDQGEVPAADVRTVTIDQTIHRYRHVGGPSVAGPGGTRVLASWSSAVRTRPSGATRKGTTGTAVAVSSHPSGAHRTASKRHTVPATRPSGGSTKPAGGTHTTGQAPATKPSGSSGSSGGESGSGTTTTPPTTKPSGSSGSSGGESGSGTTPTPPTTKPSGSSGSGEGGTGEHEHHDDGEERDN